MKHPFSYADIEAGRSAFLPNNLYSVDAMLQAVWDSAVKRGAVTESYGDVNWTGKDGYFIKLPEDKT